MYILGIIHFILGYWVYKYLFFRYNRKAYGFDEAIPMYTMKLMKWGIFLHLLFNTFMYSNKRLMTPENYDTTTHYRSKNAPLGIFFSRRFDILPNLSVLMLFILVVVLYSIFMFIIKPCAKCTAREIKLRKAKSMQKNEIDKEDPDGMELEA